MRGPLFKSFVMIPFEEQIEKEDFVDMSQDPASATEKPYMRIYDSRHQFEEDWHACTEQGISPDDAYYY